MNIFSTPAFWQFAVMMSCLLILFNPLIIPRLLLSRTLASPYKRGLAVLAYLLIMAAASAVLIAGPFKHSTPICLLISFVAGHLVAHIVSNLLNRFMPKMEVTNGIGTLLLAYISARLLLWALKHVNDPAGLFRKRDQ